MSLHLMFFVFFFFNDTATTEIYTLSLHDALPILSPADIAATAAAPTEEAPLEFALVDELHETGTVSDSLWPRDRKSTRLNSSHQIISYAVFCLKKKKKPKESHRTQRLDT